MITNWIRRASLAAVIAGTVITVGASTAEAGGYQVRSRYGYYGPRAYYGPRTYYAPSYRVYRPGIVTPNYGYYPYGPGITINTYPNYYRSYRVSPALPWGGYGVGGYPPGASWGGGSNRGFSLYIGR